MTDDSVIVPATQPQLASQPTGPAEPPPPGNTIFRGPKGLRSGWRALIFTGIFVVALFALLVPIGILVRYGVIPRATALTPLGVSISETAMLLAAILAALLMAYIERGNFSAYGLPLRFAFGKHFWIGTIAGFAAISACLLGIFACGGFHLTGMGIHGKTLLGATVAWSIAFAIVGLSEEFIFRGYLQYTLSTGIGFWPSALLLSVLFGAVHAGNQGETLFGLLQVVAFGLLFCLFLRRTGNLWWAVGFHAGWDWGQTFFYGVPDSGLPGYHSLFTSSFSGGPSWLTGGTVGPEASVFTTSVLLVVAFLFSRVYRAAPPPAPRLNATAAGGMATS
jgi:membrane protease YdiL (CAAX protease family)